MTNAQLLEIITCALNNKTYNDQITDIDELFSLAQDNGLSGILFTAVDRNIVPKYYTNFYEEFLYYNKIDVMQLEAVKNINNLLNEYHIDHIFLKGSYLKTIYPYTYMRSMGDIDILIKDLDLPKAHEILPPNGFKNTVNSLNHDSFVGKGGIHIEIHPKLNSDFDDKYDILFENVWGNTYKVNEFEYQLIPEYNLVYLLYHAVKHLTSSGIGLRTILDIGLFIEKHKEALDLDKLKELIDKTQLSLFFRNILWLIERCFSLNPLPMFTDSHKPDVEFLNDLISFIIKSGVHGYGKDFNSYICGMAANAIKKDNVKKGKRTYIIRLFFPKYKSMVSTYTYLRKHKWLLPYSWIHRGAKLLFTKTKRSFKQLNKLKVKNKELDKYTELYKKLGI